MHFMGIYNGDDLRKVSEEHLVEVFGKAGHIFYNFARGIDERPVVTYRERKSVGCEQTFLEEIYTKSAVVIELYHAVLELAGRIEKSGFEGRTLTLKIKFADFTQITRSISQEKILKKKEEILPLAKRLLQQVDYSSIHPIRLIGLSVSNATSEEARMEDKENSTQSLNTKSLNWSLRIERDKKKAADGILPQLLFLILLYFPKLTFYLKENYLPLETQSYNLKT